MLAEPAAAGLQKQVQDHVLTKSKAHPASSAAERTHFKYSGNENDIIACLISPMMSRYLLTLWRVASDA